MREWTFDRFRDGQLLAEAASAHADSQVEAEQKVRAGYGGFPSCKKDTYVVRSKWETFECPECGDVEDIDTAEGDGPYPCACGCANLESIDG